MAGKFLSLLRRPAPVENHSAPPMPLLRPEDRDGPPMPPKREAIMPAASAPSVSASAEPRRLLFGFDATASRGRAWKQATRMTDTLLATLPDRLQVALAVHGGGWLHTVTRYTTDAGKLRDKAGGIRCQGGYTRMLDMLAHAAALNANLVLYIGDCFEELARRARQLADRLGERGVRVIILQEGKDEHAQRIFAEIAERTGGAVLPFDISSFERIGKELLELVAVLAVEGVEAVEAKKDTAPAARLLLDNLDPKRLLIGHSKG